MTGSVAIDVVLGLVFIYLLYSLPATVLCEIISVHLGLRARNLQQAIRRMLEDLPEASENKILALLNKRSNNYNNMPTSKQKYNRPCLFSIRYCQSGSRNIARKIADGTVSVTLEEWEFDLTIK